MKRIFFLLIITIDLFAQYSFKSPYLRDSEKILGYVDSCAVFWKKAYDNTNGGFYTNVDRQGNPGAYGNYNKHIISQCRDAYGYTRAFMLTGKDEYLNYAKLALNFMYNKMWDNSNGGWYNECDRYGNVTNKTSDKSAFNYHYALLGISAFYEATLDSATRIWVDKAYNNSETKLWDSRSNSLGYFDNLKYDQTGQSGKSFNSTMDALTTHLIHLYLVTKDDKYKNRILQIKNNIFDHFIAGMPQQKMGFIEIYDSFWNGLSSTQDQRMTIMGHVLKTSWCLSRIYHIFGDTSCISGSEKLISHVLEKGYDWQNGGPYKDYDRVSGNMLMWGISDTAKAWWQMEQAVMAGLELYDITQKEKYLKVADESLNFFMNYFVDHTYGEVYSDRTKYGKGIASWGDSKGGSGKAAYHSIETGYYTYLFSKVYLEKKNFSLYYKFGPYSKDTQVELNPLDYKLENIKIVSVLKDGKDYNNFLGNSRTLVIPAGTSGIFKVEFQPSYIVANENRNNIADKQYCLIRNYPNPFNPKTTISYNLTSSANVDLRVYDILGREVASLINEFQNIGLHSVNFDAKNLPSGTYIALIKAGSFRKALKMNLLK